MAITRTNTNLALFCLQVVGAPYWFGCFGQKGSASLHKEKKAQYPSYYNFPYNTYSDDFGKRVTDCAGLIKWFLWSNNMTDKAPTYKASEDYGANGFWNKCTSKGKISTIPSDKIGLLVFKGTDKSKTHVGVVVDNNGTVVEAKGHNYGTIKSKVSEWGYWGKCHLITYSKPEPAPVPTPTPTPTPEPTPKPTVVTKKVAAKSGLWLHSKPNSLISTRTYCMSYGDTFMVSKTTNGWSYGTWVKTGKKGYASAKYLK